MIKKTLTAPFALVAIASLAACGHYQDFASKLSPQQRDASEIAFYAPPAFPDEAARNCEAGSVLVQYDVAFNGDVKPESVRVLADAGSQALADAAVSAVTRWKYAPAVQGNTLTERKNLRTAVNFEIEGCDPASFDKSSNRKAR